MKQLRIVFNENVSKEDINRLVDWITIHLITYEITGVQFVEDVEECEDEQES